MTTLSPAFSWTSSFQKFPYKLLCIFALHLRASPGVPLMIGHAHAFPKIWVNLWEPLCMYCSKHSFWKFHYLSCVKLVSCVILPQLESHQYLLVSYMPLFQIAALVEVNTHLIGQGSLTCSHTLTACIRLHPTKISIIGQPVTVSAKAKTIIAYYQLCKYQIAIFSLMLMWNIVFDILTTAACKRM